MEKEALYKLFSAGRFDEFIEHGLKKARDLSNNTSSQQRQENLKLLYHLLAACEQLGYYCNYLDILQKYNELDPLESTRISRQTIIQILTFALESLIYCLYNNESEHLGITYNIQNQVEKILGFLNERVQEIGHSFSLRQQELEYLYEDYQKGKAPVYSIEFLYPFEPIIEDYTFDLSPCYPYISMEVRKVQIDSAFFTLYKITAYGLIKPDSFWKGPKWEMQVKYPPISKALPLVNMMLLQAVKASPGKMVMPFSIEQVSTVSMYQYRWDREQTVLRGTITGTDFQSQWVGNNAQWHKFSGEEMRELNQALVDGFGSKPFVTTFHHAANLMSAGFNTEAFLLICACSEGLLYHWCEEIALRNGRRDEYLEFSRTGVSKCDSCKYFTGKVNEIPIEKAKPTVFAHIKYLHDQGWITKPERQELNKCLSTIRNDRLRNNTTHGINYSVSKREADQSMESLLALQERFVNIVKRIDNKRNGERRFP